MKIGAYEEIYLEIKILTNVKSPDIVVIVMENGTPDDYARFLQRAAERQSQSNAELATWLRSWLERRGMSQKAFSIRACLGAEEVSKLCSARLNWSPRYMSRISEATGLAISQIHRQAEAV